MSSYKTMSEKAELLISEKLKAAKQKDLYEKTMETEIEKLINSRLIAARRAEIKREQKLIYVVPTEEAQALGRVPRVGYEANSLDLYFVDKLEAVYLAPDTTLQIPLGIKTYCLPGTPGMLCIPRSSSSLLSKGNKSFIGREKDSQNKYFYTYKDRDYGSNIQAYYRSSLTLENTIGYIDWDWRGEWMARVSINDWQLTYTDDRNYELLLNKPYLQTFCTDETYKFVIVNNLDEVPEEYKADTSRGEKGFGSSG